MKTDFVLTDAIRGDVWATLVGRSTRLLDRWLTGESPLIGADTDRGPAAVALRKAASSWAAAKTALDGIPPALEALPDMLVAIRSNPDYSSEAKNRLITEAVDRVNTVTSASADVVRSKLTRVDELLRAASMPPRPGDTAVDEARIAAAKSDLKMVLDAERGDPIAIADCMANLLQRAIGDGDTHATWVLVGTRWPGDYIRARDGNRNLKADQVTVLVDERLGLVLDEMSGQDFAEVRRTYRAVVSPDGTWALEAVVGQLPSLLEDVKDWALRFVPDDSFIARARAAGQI